MARELRGIVPAVLAVLVLAAVAAVAAHVPASRSVRAAPTPTATSTPGPRDGGRIAAAATGVPWWLVVLGIAALLVVVGPMVWLAVRGLTRRRAPGREPGEGEISRVSERLPGADDALADAAEDLRAGGDAREVVIACWVRLEAAAEAAGRGRRPSETATDVARRWLGADSDDRAAVDELAGLFHEARYSTHAVTDEQRERARRALSALTGTRA